MGLSIRGARPDERRGSINVQINPGATKPNVVDCTFNSHFEFDAKSTAAIAVDLIANVWEDTMRLAEATLVGVVEDSIKAKVNE